MDLFQTETKNLLEDGIALYAEKWVESRDRAAESLDDGKDTNLEDLNPLRIHNEVLLCDGEPADAEIEPKTEEQDAGVIKPSIEPKVEEALENNLAEAFNAMELNTELSLVEAADVGLEPSMDMEEELMKDLRGDPAVPVKSVTIEQLDEDEGVLGIQADPNEEENLKNNSTGECSNKKQDATAVDQVVSTPNLITGGMAALSLPLTVDSNENLSNLGVGEVTDVTQVFVPTIKASSPSPRKIPLQKTVSSKTPTSGKRIIMLVSDDKENIEDIGTSLITAAKEKDEKKGICMENSERACWDETTSLRKLKKELKAKLEEKANNKNIKGGAVTRPALQALPDNPLVGGNS